MIIQIKHNFGFVQSSSLLRKEGQERELGYSLCSSSRMILAAGIIF